MVWGVGWVDGAAVPLPGLYYVPYDMKFWRQFSDFKKNSYCDT